MNHSQPKHQEALIAHLTNPETIKHAVEGSIEKRLEVITRLNPPTGLLEYTTEELLAEIEYRRKYNVGRTT